MAGERGRVIRCEECGGATHRITKKRVDMVRLVIADGSGEIEMLTSVDWVRIDVLHAYLDFVRPHWGKVTVSRGYDAGPEGYHGVTYIPKGLNHPLAGANFPADHPVESAA